MARRIGWPPKRAASAWRICSIRSWLFTPRWWSRCRIRSPLCTRPCCRNEVLTALNKPEDFILAIVRFGEGGGHEVRYVREPFGREPDFGAVSVTYGLEELWGRGTLPCRPTRPSCMLMNTASADAHTAIGDEAKIATGKERKMTEQARSRSPKRVEQHGTMLREALRRPGVREVMEVYGAWERADKELDTYRAATRRVARFTTTDRTNTWTPPDRERPAMPAHLPAEDIADGAS